MNRVGEAVIGRRNELAAIERFLAGLDDGPAALTISGSAGVGKSTVWLAGTALAEGAGCRMLTARPTGAEASLSFAALADLLASVEEGVLAELPAPQRRALDVALLRDEAVGRLDSRAVATAAQISESFLSQLERGRTNATIATLQRLATALGIEVSDLFTGNSARPRVLRREAREFVAWGRLGSKALLTPKPFHSLEVVVARFEPGGSTGDEPYTHGDSEELLIVVQGQVHVQLGTEIHEVAAGDSVHYQSSTPHRVSNPGDAAAEVLFVISPPSY